MLLLDLDHFKQINDTYGHDAATTSSPPSATRSRPRCATSDFVGRYGGEEFLVLLPDTGADGALETAEKIRAAIASVTMPRYRPCDAASAARRCTHTRRRPRVPRSLADRAPYAAKRGGGLAPRPPTPPRS